jgi:excisionase family DNA binding protein
MAEREPELHKHLSIGAFSARYGVGKTKIYQLLNSGELPAVKIGTRTMIAVDAAERWRNGLPDYKPLRS